MNTEWLISSIEDLTRAILDLTEAVKESILISKEEMAFVQSPEFVENLSKVVDSALDEAVIGRDMLDR